MPIRINLLAEAQDIEDLRRRDPVKRVILAGVGLVFLMLAWSSSLLVQTMVAKGDVSRLEGQISSLETEFRQILQNQTTLNDSKTKLQELRRLANNRFLVGNLLNALQKTTLDDVQLVRLRLDQTFAVTEPPKTKDENARAPTKPATSTEKVVLTLAAKDKSPTPGDGVSKFQSLLSGEPYFQKLLGETNGFRLASLGATQKTEPDGKPFLLLTLEGRPPEKTR